MNIPPSWTFHDDSVASHFGSHVREQLPWYDVVSDALVSVVRHYAPEGGRIIDIGAADGNMGRRLLDTVDERHIDFMAVEESEDFKYVYKAPGRVFFENAVGFDYPAFDVAICYLVLMFMTKDDRKHLLEELQYQVRSGGAIIVVERFIPSSGYAAVVTSRMAMAGKVAQGVDPRQIVEKELSLAGMQRPLDPEELPEGYEWFRMGDFRGYVLEG